MVYGDHNGDVACDQYHRYRDDVRLMKEIGLKSYRFSVAWSRILPEGSGTVNATGIDFYRRLVDELLANAIVPMATLYHWDLPQALQDRGDWLHRDTIEHFAEYAAGVFRALGDRVRLWITHNEPEVVAFLGHKTGERAPGIRDDRTALEVSHHLLLSQAHAVLRYRELRGAAGKIGIALNLSPAYPASESLDDRGAAGYCDGVQTRWFLDPVFRGRYPQEVLALYQGRLGAPEVTAGDLELLSRAAVDFLGVNHYTRTWFAVGNVRTSRSRPSGRTILQCASRTWAGRCIPKASTICSCV